jgi:DNA-binding MarR family transcriptional regulator
VDKPCWSRLLHVAAGLEARIEASIGMSLAKHGILSVLAESPEPLPLVELARRLACVKSNVTQLVNRLEAEGLVERRECHDDKRSKRAALTPEGRSRWEASSLALRQATESLLSGFTGEELRTLARLLDKFQTC